MHVGSLHIYPVKGGRDVSTGAAEVAPEGLDNDRRWMVVDGSGRFVSQRELPILVLLDAAADPDGLVLTFEDAAGERSGERFVPTPDGSERLQVTVWQSAVDVAVADEATNAALSRWLGAPLRLVFLDKPDARFADPAFAGPRAPVSFADGFPLLVANEASLRALNAAIVADGGEPVPMSRFRPNIVVAGAEAWQEDGWQSLRVGGTLLDLVKPCARCQVTTVDQQTGRIEGPEPLASLRRLRFSADRRVPGLIFGWNAVPRAAGRIEVGDEIEVLGTRSEPVVRAVQRDAPEAEERLGRTSGSA